MFDYVSNWVQNFVHVYTAAKLSFMSKASARLYIRMIRDS